MIQSTLDAPNFWMEVVTCFRPCWSGKPFFPAEQHFGGPVKAIQNLDLHAAIIPQMCCICLGTSASGIEFDATKLSKALLHVRIGLLPLSLLCSNQSCIWISVWKSSGLFAKKLDFHRTIATPFVRLP